MINVAPMHESGTHTSQKIRNLEMFIPEMFILKTLWQIKLDSCNHMTVQQQKKKCQITKYIVYQRDFYLKSSYRSLVVYMGQGIQEWIN